MVELKVSFFRSHVSLHDLSSNVQDTAKVRQVTGVLYEPHVVKEGIRKIQLIGRDSKVSDKAYPNRGKFERIRFY